MAKRHSPRPSARGKIKNATPRRTAPTSVPQLGTENIASFLAGIVDTEKFENTLSQAVGFNQFGSQGANFGYPGGYSGQQVEDSTTIFENLRWYLVSNFRQMLSQAFVEIGLIQTICCVPVDDALRGGFSLKSMQINEAQIKQLQVSMKRDGDIHNTGWAGKWNRLYGGAAILIIVGDQDPEEELDIKSIGKDTDIEFRAVDMWELFWDKQNIEGYDPALQQEDFEFYNYYGEPVHKSRVLRLKGSEAPSFIRPRLRGWGLSEVERLVRSINQYLKSTALTFEVLDEFKVDVYKIKNLVNTLLSPNGTQKVRERIALANWQKNFQKGIAMDSEDEFEYKQISFAGLAEAQEGIRMQVAADMRMPITKLFGTTAGKGLGATDQNDMENYNSMVQSEVRDKLEYCLLRIAELKCQKLFGFIPDDLELEFPPLRELTAVEQETVKTQKFTRALQAMEASLINPKQFADICNKGDIFDIHLDTIEDGNDQNDDVATDKDESKDEDVNGDTDGNDHIDTDKTKIAPGSKQQPPPKAIATDKVVNHLTKFKVRRITNSAEFNRASYEADGGDAWISDARRALFEKPAVKDPELWKKAGEAAQQATRTDNWKFKVWWYKKEGGKF